ncbi:YtrH family sporulation protein [Dehalobacterium formicoaceticum]|uniref:YtrH family sporulation protein n=1 Tax=Dehalobacterium formicoaceticum TaxID=51515 RepID=A0ABT1Y5B5_9FIRM|nr:YtrH family sporulation protein [Dehalobacterium formicoaceticum]MCR6546075.1 YtrH family sporulation protein [Dehalobacterium formicoaceticum]
MNLFYQKLLLIYFTALGVLVGASLIGSIAAVITRYPPIEILLRISREIKIWAIVAAIGGTFSTIEILQLGILEGEIRALIKQLFYIISAFAGAHTGYLIITHLVGRSL